MKNTISIFLFALFLSFLFGCYEPTEGCLEINASNFNVLADDPCEKCCELPQLTISILNRLSQADSTESFRINQWYPSGTDSFLISGLHFYLSDIQLVTQSGDTKTSIDSSEIFFLENSMDTQEISITNDIAFFKRGFAESKTLGDFLPGGTYSQFEFRFGLPEERLTTLPQKTSNSHPLGYQRDSLNYSNGSYVLCRIDFVTDTSKLDTPSAIQITHADVENTDLANLFVLDANYTLSTGFDTKLTLRLDFLNWVEDVDWNESNEDIKNKIIRNIPGSFSLETPEQN